MRNSFFFLLEKHQVYCQHCRDFLTNSAYAVRCSEHRRFCFYLHRKCEGIDLTGSVTGGYGYQLNKCRGTVPG
jgi:hypothetical protein